jgi:hypothetical protein
VTSKYDTYIRADNAKRLIRRWANHFDDPEYLVKRRDVLQLTEKQRQEVFSYIRRIAQCMRNAFEAADDYERDWFLFMARFNNAADLNAPFGRLPGFITMAKDSTIDQAVWHVQRLRIAKKMAFCKREGCEHPCYFRGGRKYCSNECREIVLQSLQRTDWAKRGSARRRERREREKSLR